MNTPDTSTNQTQDALALPASWPAPESILTPTDVSEIAELVRQAEAEGVAILPCGNGTQLETGFPPAPKPYRLLCTHRLNRITDYQPADLTVTVEPGVTLSQLQELLASHRQMLPLDVPLSHYSTLGGIVSANQTGFWRTAYGAPRDMLIGLRAVTTGSIEIKGGGKVVKNVAGYDLCKLYTGAWGTLGVLTELTFKVRTLPETEALIGFDAPDLATAARAGLALHHARLALTFVLVTNEPQSLPRLIVGMQGIEARTSWQITECARLAASAGLAEAPVSLSQEEVNLLRDKQARTEPDTAVAARIATLPDRLPELLKRLEAVPDLVITSLVGTGTVNLATARAVPSPVPAIQAAVPPGANIVWTRLASDVPEQATLARWGEAKETIALHRALKTALDPKNTFSPGRFLGRL